MPAGDEETAESQPSHFVMTDSEARRNLGGLKPSFVAAEEARLARVPGTVQYCRAHCHGDGHAADCPRREDTP